MAKHSLAINARGHAVERARQILTTEYTEAVEVDTGLAPRTPFVMGRKCTEDERSESEETFERSEK